MLSIEILRNFLTVGKNLAIPAAIFLPVGNGGRLAGESDKTAPTARDARYKRAKAVTPQCEREH